MSNLQQAAVQSTRRTFIDLRKFAQDKSQGVSLTASAGDDPFLSSRRLLDLPPGLVTAGAIALETGNGAVQSQPADEFIIVCEGTLTLTQQDRTLTLGPGQSAVIQHGAGQDAAMKLESYCKQMYADMQVLVHEQGGIGIPMFNNSLDGFTNKLKGYSSHPLAGLMGYTFAENVWLDA